MPLCPRCRSLSVTMVATRLGTEDALGCPHCRGIFVTYEHLATIRAGRDAEAVAAADQAAQASVPVAIDTFDSVPLLCAHCTQPMAIERVTVREQTVRIDRCATHGVFLDAHELTAIAPDPKERSVAWDVLEAIGFVGMFFS